MISKRWSFAGLAGLLILACALPMQAASCSGVAAWVNTKTYAVGAQVTYAGGLYKAQASTTNVAPNYCTTCGWWQFVGTCSSGGTSGGGGTTTTSCSYPNWVAGANYNVGNIVKYAANGKYYKCTNANPGYDPTISTWFWAAYTCNGGGGTATCNAAPAVPTGLRSSNVTTSSVQLNWSGVSTPANCSVTYNVYRNGTKIVTVPTTGANMTGLAAGTAYNFTVASVDGAGTSSQSGVLKVTTAASTSTCNYPNWVAGTNYNVGNIVKYPANGHFYKCTNANPGYDPTISTWFWSSFTCNGGGGGGGDTGGGIQKPGEVPADQWSYMVNAASKLGMPADFARLVAAMDKHESNFGAWLTGGSPSAGDGLMQVQPATRSAYSGNFSSVFGHGYNHGSASDQIGMGALIVKDMISRCGGQYRCGLMKYNGGPNYVPGSVDAYGRPIYAEQYAAECMSYYQSFGGTHQ